MAARAQLVPLRDSDADDREVTVYVKGFLGRGEKPDRFDSWLTCHDALRSSHGWGSRALGYHWPSGDFRSTPLALLGAAKGAVDVFRILRNLRRAAVLSHLGWLAAEEATFLAALFVRQYLAAARSAEALADEQVAHLEELAERHERVRVVAHSLGCRQVIESVSRMEWSQRPHEIHLCAPACREDVVADKLAHLARERTFVYYTDKDRVLDLGFTPMARGRALGFTGPVGLYPGLVACDVSQHFDFWVHGEYKNRFERLVPRAEMSAGPQLHEQR